jgi:hypothetical protein
MEIKHSSPSVARPVEHHAGKRRWPWVLLIVLGALIVIGGIIAGLYFYGGKLISKKDNQANQANETNQTNDTQPDQQSSAGFDVKPEPDTDDLTSLVISRNEASDQAGKLTLLTADATDSGTLTETKVLTLDPKLTGPIEAQVSPNGQFALVYQSDHVGGTVPPEKFGVSIVELSTGKEAIITDSLEDYPYPLFWTPDSEHVIFFVNKDGNGPIQSANSYDVASGELASTQFSVVEGEDMSLIPFSVTENDVFVTRTQIDADGELGDQEIGTLSLSDDAQIGTDFEKIIDVTNANRGMDVSSDGKFIAITRGGLGDPTVLELLNRETGEIQELRKSATEDYSSPLFTRDGESIIYSAASGIWMLEIESGDRTQLADSAEFDIPVSTPAGSVTPHLISPNDEILVIAVPAGQGNSDFFVLPIGSETVAKDDMGEIEPVDSDEDGRLNVDGWTI